MSRLIGLFAIAAAAVAQPSFEVASIRLIPPDKAGYTVISPSGAGTFTATNVTLEVLIGMAYGINSNLISTKQKWIESQSYDVSAKPEGAQGLTYEQLRPMLQKLLEERFKLKVHRESKDSQGYALLVAKDGPKLQATQGGQAKPMILKNGLRANNVSMATFAWMLSRPTGRQVVDKTGIPGNFDFKLDYAPEGVTDSSLPSVFTALQEQLGLKLTPQKVSVETLVIDSAKRVPTEN
jgi:uncharacterized protein (TIGR03435 family)